MSPDLLLGVFKRLKPANRWHITIVNIKWYAYYERAIKNKFTTTKCQLGKYILNEIRAQSDHLPSNLLFTI